MSLRCIADDFGMRITTSERKRELRSGQKAGSGDDDFELAESRECLTQESVMQCWHILIRSPGSGVVFRNVEPS